MAGAPVGRLLQIFRTPESMRDASSVRLGGRWSLVNTKAGREQKPLYKWVCTEMRVMPRRNTDSS